MHHALWQEVEGLEHKASDFTRAWLGSLERVSAVAAWVSQWVSDMAASSTLVFLPRGTIVRGDADCSPSRGKPAA